jgi:hypothetical protein
MSQTNEYARNLSLTFVGVRRGNALGLGERRRRQETGAKARRDQHTRLWAHTDIAKNKNRHRERRSMTPTTQRSHDPSGRGDVRGGIQGRQTQPPRIPRALHLARRQRRAAYSMIGLNPAEAAGQRATPPMGGTLRIQMEVRALKDPRTYDWSQMANMTRGILEYLIEYNARRVLLGRPAGKLGGQRRRLAVHPARAPGRDLQQR